LVVSSAHRISVIRTLFYTSTALDSTDSALTLFMLQACYWQRSLRRAVDLARFVRHRRGKRRSKHGGYDRTPFRPQRFLRYLRETGIVSPHAASSPVGDGDRAHRGDRPAGGAVSAQVWTPVAASAPSRPARPSAVAVWSAAIVGGSRARSAGGTA